MLLHIVNGNPPINNYLPHIRRNEADNLWDEADQSK